jgi:hypothetical protein
MAEKKPETKEFGLKDLVGDLLPLAGEDSPGFNPDDNIEYRDPEEVEKEIEEEKKSASSKKDTAQKTTKKTDEEEKDEELEDSEEKDEEDSEKDDEDKNKGEESDEGSDEEKSSELGEYESDIAEFFVSKLAEELGWEIDEDLKVEGVSDVVELIKKTVEENSRPEYPSEEVEEVARFVENGGSLKDFVETVYGGEVDFKNIDLDDEENQKKVIRENLKDLGYSAEKINKVVDRYETAGVLEDEARDALETLVQRREETKKKLLEEQENYNKTIKKQQLEFINNVNKELKNTTDFYGYQLTDKEKKELYDDLFKPLADGQTKFQKEYNKNGVRNLIETAMFLKYKDKLFKDVSKKAESNATKKLLQKIKETKGTSNKMKGSGSGGGESSTSLSDLGRFFNK